MDIQKDTKDILEGKKSFWISERIVFLGTLVSFFLFAAVLLVTEAGNAKATFHSFLDFLFDTVSVGTLTGLFRGDSGTFTFGGQFVLLLDMVINGLITSFISILLIIFMRFSLNRRESLRTELEKLNGHSWRILLFILLDFVFIWALGTTLFAYAGSRTLWEAIFNSASHILNDGVTVFPNNMVPYRENVAMLVYGAFLITIGGLGISIRGYFYKLVLRLVGLRKLAGYIPDSILAPKNFLVIILIVTVILQMLGASTMYHFELNNPHVFPSTMSNSIKLLNSYYMSVSARTAGFTTIPDLSQLHDKSMYILMLLMSIGASSGSFAGGILKLTAFIYLFIYIISRIRGDFEVETPHEHIHLSQRTVIEANFRVIGFTLILFFLTFLLFVFQPDVSGLFLAFESISAVTNTGLSLGATGLLNATGLVLIIILMTVGKLGFITTVISFFPKYQRLIENAPTGFDEFPVD